MTIKLIGALLVVASCGGVGFHVAFSHRREERLLQQLMKLLDYIRNELQYHLTPLPELCGKAAGECSGILSKAFLNLSTELTMQVFPHVGICMNAVLMQITDLPKGIHDIMQSLGNCLGRFDLDGQLKDIDIIRLECSNKLAKLQDNRDARLRTYQTLGICAGAALVIIFI